jgi:hypothetical protein
VADIRIKGHWIAGGAVALLFGVLLAIRLDVFRGSAPFLTGQAAVVAPVSRDADQWMAIFQGQRKIGYAHRALARTGQGYRFDEAVLMRVNTMGIVQDIRLKTTGETNPDMTLNAFRFDLQSSLFRFTARGVVRGRQATVHYGPPGAEREIEIALQEAPHLSGSIFDSLRGKALAAGQETTVHVLDPASMAERPVRVTGLEDETLVIMGKTQKARKVAVDFMGGRQFAWLGEDGGVLREQGLLGMMLERVTKEQALDGIEQAAGADLTEAASIRSNVLIENPAALTKLTVRLANVNPDHLLLAGGRQQYRDGLLTIEREAQPAAAPAGGSHAPEHGQYLRATPLVQSDHPEIGRQAGQIVSPGDSDAIKAEKLIAWVYRNVEKKPVLSVPNALETLTNRVGDCNEHAVLLAALARAAGIPAQIEAGLVYLNGRFFYHAWNALYLGKWVTADAVMGAMPADVTHIRLIRGEADRQIDLMGVIGRLQLEIVDMRK